MLWLRKLLAQVARGKEEGRGQRSRRAEKQAGRPRVTPVFCVREACLPRRFLRARFLQLLVRLYESLDLLAGVLLKFLVADGDLSDLFEERQLGVDLVDLAPRAAP